MRARDLVLVAGGLVLLVVAAVPADAGSVPAAERAVFRAVNGVGGVPFPPVWLVMQLGMVGVVPVAALTAAVARRGRLALSLLAAGAVAYAGGKLVKRVVERGRPADLLDGVRIHGAAAHGLGFVSGHAAVAAALATVASAHLPGAWRWVPAGLAVAVALTRVHVGAHLPLDVVGGAALGVAAGGFALLAFGRPAPCC